MREKFDPALFELAVEVAAHTLQCVDRGRYPDGIPYQDALRVAVIDAYKALQDAREELRDPDDPAGNS